MADQGSKVTEEQKRQEEERVFKEQPLHGLVSCKTCLKEIPQSIAHTEEGEDYVLYFCGLECFDQWSHPGARKRKDEEEE